jgi:hypothetical protein
VHGFTLQDLLAQGKTEAELVATGEWEFCTCHNLVAVDASVCPWCHQKRPKPPPEPEP